MEKLEGLIKQARIAYYNGQPFMSGSLVGAVRVEFPTTTVDLSCLMKYMTD